MNVIVIIIEMVVFAGLFTAIVFRAYASGKQQNAAGIHNYPPDIQEEYFKTHERIEVGYKSKSVILAKSLSSQQTPAMPLRSSLTR